MDQHVPRILIIEDDPDLQRVLSLLFAREGFEVAGAFDAPQAVTQATKKRPDVIILDLGLPGGGGFPVLERIRSREIDSPVVVLTGDATAPSAHRAMQMGAAEYLHKPVELSVLLACVLRLIRDRSAA